MVAWFGVGLAGIVDIAEGNMVVDWEFVAGIDEDIGGIVDIE